MSSGFRVRVLGNRMCAGMLPGEFRAAMYKPLLTSFRVEDVKTSALKPRTISIPADL